MVPDWGSKEVSLCVTERDRAAWYLTGEVRRCHCVLQREIELHGT